MRAAILVDALFLLMGIPFFESWYQHGFTAAVHQNDWIFAAPLMMVVLTAYLIMQEKRQRRMVQEVMAFIEIGGEPTEPEP